MPEPLGDRSGPSPQKVIYKVEPAANFEVARRDNRETAAKAAKTRDDNRIETDIKARNEQTASRRVEIQAVKEENKKVLQENLTQKKTQDIQEKRRIEDKKNPNQGNIINVVA